ncbi:P-loop containing nucleoside triphosphate hydrolase protein, partial [Hortaea werneckii]
STPHLLSSITESDPNVLSRVTHLVIDEADSLLDRSFSPTTSAIVDRATPSLQQLVLCSATIPRSLDSYVHKRFPAARRLVTPNLHAIPRRVQLSVVDIDKVPYQGNRDLACAQTIWDIGKEAQELGGEPERGGTALASASERKIVVFVNEREKTVELATYLQSKGIPATALSRDSDDRKQAAILAEFTGVPTPTTTTTTTSTTSTPTPRTTPRGVLANTKVLVMTDLGSRGIDTLAVKHVVLYDVPHTSIDFIHRLGRVGRMGRRGRGVVLVGRHDRRDVVREVREGMFRGQALI